MDFINNIMRVAWKSVYSKRYYYFKILFLPILFSIFLNITSIYGKPSSLFIYILIVIGNLIVYTTFAVFTHRAVLLGPHSVPSLTSIFLTKREFLFAGYCILLTLMTNLIARFFLTIMHPILGLILGLPLSFYLLSRLIFVLPSTAIDSPISFKTSWELSSKYQAHAFLVVFMIPIIISLPRIIVYIYPNSFTSLISGLYYIFTTILGVSCISVLYAALLKLKPP